MALSGEAKAAYGKAYHAARADVINSVRRAEYVTKKHKDVAGILLRTARSRAKAKGIACTIKASDILVPDKCPVLGLILKKSDGYGPSDNSPSLDQIVPGAGYVPGNVRVISHRANRLKCDATIEELELVLLDLTTLKKGA